MACKYNSMTKKGTQVSEQEAKISQEDLMGGLAG